MAPNASRLITHYVSSLGGKYFSSVWEQKTKVVWRIRSETAKQVHHLSPGEPFCLFTSATCHEYSSRLSSFMIIRSWLEYRRISGCQVTPEFFSDSVQYHLDEGKFIRLWSTRILPWGLVIQSEGKDKHEFPWPSSIELTSRMTWR